MQIAIQTQLLHQGIDATWEPENSSGCSLALIISGRHCTAVVFDSGQQKFVYLKSFVSGNAEDFIRTEWLKENFPFITYLPVRFYFSGIKTTLVPEALYNETLKSNFLQFNHKILPEEKTESILLKNLDARLVYTEYSQLIERLKENYPAAGFYHASAGWLENLGLQYKNEESDHVHIDFEGDKIDIAFFREGSLHLFNSFLCSNDDDRLYYPLFISEQLRINPRKDNFYLSGFLEKDSETHRLFRKYIKNLHFQERPAQFKYSLPLMALPEHLYYKSFCTPVCAL